MCKHLLWSPSLHCHQWDPLWGSVHCLYVIQRRWYAFYFKNSELVVVACRWHHTRHAAHEILTKVIICNYHPVFCKEAILLASSMLKSPQSLHWWSCPVGLAFISHCRSTSHLRSSLSLQEPNKQMTPWPDGDTSPACSLSHCAVCTDTEVSQEFHL